MKKFWAFLGCFLVPMVVIAFLVFGALFVLTSDTTQKGAEIDTAGIAGLFIVKAESQVCVNGISEGYPFSFNTPSGTFASQIKIGQYYYGEGCFAPGNWVSEKAGTVSMHLSNPTGVEVTHVQPKSVKQGLPIVLGVILLIAAAAFFGVYRSIVGKN